MTDGEYTIDELKALEAEEYNPADEPEEEEAQQDDEPSQLQLPESTRRGGAALFCASGRSDA
jgi:hypothetical protein